MTNQNNSRNEFAISKENKEINEKQNLQLVQSNQANQSRNVGEASRTIINEDSIHEKT